TEFRGPKRRNLQQTGALVNRDVFTEPQLTTTTLQGRTHSLQHATHKRSRYNYTVVQQVRQRALDAACRQQTITRETWSDLSQSQRTALADRIIVNEEHKLLFCPVPLTSIGPWMKVLYLLGPNGKQLKSTD
ncbi:Carbohydrate sulfotransferase 14, partial [Geodia barretti]